MSVPFMSLSDSLFPIREEIDKKISQIINETNFIGGEELDLFEQEFAAYCGIKYATGCSNGTDALILALKALGIGPGDKVITVPNTFIATAEAISFIGAEVIFVDIEKDFYTMDPQKLDEYLQKNYDPSIKAVIPVHLFGQMADMPEICKISEKYNLKVIEDSAQAHGAKINGKGPGYYGSIATYSFYPGKNLGAFGDAGAVVTNDPGLHKKIKMLVNHGRWNEKYTHKSIGMNCRMDTLQAAILRIKMRHLEKWTEERITKASVYKNLLKNKSIQLPETRSNCRHVFHLFVIKTEKRDDLIKALTEEGISSGIHYPVPLHLQEAYSFMGHKKNDFPITEQSCNQILSLPFWPEISNNQISDVCRVIS